MINSVTLKKFRGFSDVTVPLSNVTLLTGTNGVGKTSVLEGLYCLFSDARLDVHSLVRYNRTVGISVDHLINGIPNLVSRQTYNYRLFWDECPMFNEQTCCVSANGKDGSVMQWTFTKAKMSDIDAQTSRDAGLMGITIDSSTDIALFRWDFFNNKTDQKQEIASEIKSMVQVLKPDGGLYLIPPENRGSCVCKYLDFVSLKARPQELSYQTAKKLTESLKFLNPRITDIRISKIEHGLSVILDGDSEITLGTIGNGAVTLSSTLIEIFEVVERFKKADQQSDVPVYILIDEIGAGIHYSVMDDVWKCIRDFTVEYPNIQFVMTSHSYDCVRSFCNVFVGNTDASIVRLHRAVGNEIVPTQYDHSRFGGIVSDEMEVRG